MRLLGLDPGLRHTGWGVIEADGNRLSHIANGVVTADHEAPLAQRLATIYDGIIAVIAAHCPSEAAVEESFVNRNPASALKLGLARGVILLAPAKAGLGVYEYAANRVKKAVVGAGHAHKQQIGAMVAILLPGCKPDSEDAADALAIAICHAHYRGAPSAVREALAAGAST